MDVQEILGPELTFDGPTHVVWRGTRLMYFAGTDYHRLAFEPAVQTAVQEELRQQGLSSGGSRLTTGNNSTLLELEKTLARFFQVENALVVGSGYLANLILLQAIREEFDSVIADEQAHASLLDAARAVQLPVAFFKHRDPNSLEHLMTQQSHPHRTLVVTDGIFAARGEVAPIRDYWRIISTKGAALLIDDAHGMGVLGKTGRGTWEAQGTELSDRLFVTGTLSKGFGVFGGVILSSHVLKQRIITSSPAFVGHTPMPVPAIAGATAAVQFLSEHRHRIQELQTRARQVKQALIQAGYAMSADEVPIISVPFSDRDTISAFKAHLIQEGIFPPFNRYPGAPAGGHFRFVVTSRHTKPEIDHFLEVLGKFQQMP